MNILVFIEIREGKVRSSGLEALTAARKLADIAGGSVTGLLVGQALSGHVDQLSKYGVDRVLLAEHPDLSSYSPEGYREAVVSAAAVMDAKVIVMTSTSLGRDLAPMVAARLDAAFLPDCVAVDYSEGRMTVSRPVYAGKCTMTLTATAWPVVLSLRLKAFPAATREGKTPEVTPLTVDLEGKLKTRCIETRPESGGRLDVTEADVIVAGGRGMKAPENFQMIEDLAAVLHGAVGASRAVVDAGWRSHSEQVGQTGKVVSPTLYFACGISGAIQHLAGMRSSKVIVAINKDPEAPIFKNADYGIVGDAMEVLPILTAAIKSLV